MSEWNILSKKIYIFLLYKNKEIFDEYYQLVFINWEYSNKKENSTLDVKIRIVIVIYGYSR